MTLCKLHKITPKMFVWTRPKWTLTKLTLKIEFGLQNANAISLTSRIPARFSVQFWHPKLNPPKPFSWLRTKPVLRFWKPAVLPGFRLTGKPVAFPNKHGAITDDKSWLTSIVSIFWMCIGIDTFRQCCLRQSCVISQFTHLSKRTIDQVEFRTENPLKWPDCDWGSSNRVWPCNSSRDFEMMLFEHGFSINKRMLDTAL